jgi:glycosyltransferase involved in cell wall biosynthesis
MHRPIPSVAVVHDLGQLNIDDKYDRLRMFYFKQIALRLVVAADRKVAISENTRDHMVSALHLAREEIQVIPNGVDCARFTPVDAQDPKLSEMRRELGLDGSYLLYPARLEHPAKNHLRLLEAFSESKLAETHTLALSGADWGGGELIRSRIDQLGLAKKVVLLGFVSTEILPALVAGADAVIMVGLTEGFGLPALEALAAGRPVCAARAGALPEVVGDLGALCDPLEVSSIAEALRKTVFDSEYRARCQSEGPKWASRFSWEATASSLAALCIEAGSTVTQGQVRG